MIDSGYVKYHDPLQDDLVPIHSIRQHPDNPNNGDTDEIIASIEENGMYHSITVQESTGYILEGNHTWLACVELGATHIPAKRIDVDDTTALRILMGDNRIAQLAMLDRGIELANLERLRDNDALRGSGYDDDRLEHLRTVAARPLVPADMTQPWKTICFQIPPDTHATFIDLTEDAGGMKERFEMLLRLASER